MKKLKREIELSSNNEFIEIINDLLDGGLGGDWSNWNEGDKVVYKFDLRDDDYWEDFEGIDYDSFIEFIGEGFCLLDKEYDFDVWYNVEVKDGIVLISYIYIDSDKF